MVGKIGVGFIDTGLPVLEIANIHHPTDQVAGRILPHRNAHMQANSEIQDVDAIFVKPPDRNATNKHEAGAALQLVTQDAKLRAEVGKRKIVNREIGKALSGTPHGGNRRLKLVALGRCQRPDPAVVTGKIRTLPHAWPA